MKLAEFGVVRAMVDLTAESSNQLFEILRQWGEHVSPYQREDRDERANRTFRILRPLDSPYPGGPPEAAVQRLAGTARPLTKTHEESLERVPANRRSSRRQLSEQRQLADVLVQKKVSDGNGNLCVLTNVEMERKIMAELGVKQREA